MTENNQGPTLHVFGQGLMFRRPREGAPDFIKGSLSINIKDFIEFAKTQRSAGNISEKGWLNLDLKESIDGTKLYFQVDTWKPTKKVEEKTSEGVEGETINPDDIPF